MLNFQSITPIQSLQMGVAEQLEGQANGRSSMFTQIFDSLVENVKQTDAAKNQAYYALATGQLDNPAEATIAATQASVATELMVQMRDRALEAYNELMRISL